MLPFIEQTSISLGDTDFFIAYPAQITVHSGKSALTYSLERLLPILRCPISSTKLKRIGNELISESNHRYPIVNGKPILVKNVQPMHINVPDRSIISQNINEFSVPAGFSDDFIMMNLGSGNVPASDKRVISVDILPTDNVDLVCEAEALPFIDNCIDYISSGAVFEHVYNPLVAASEARRIIKEGGLLYIDTAFLQGYHGYPSHFFNMTPQAAETHLIDDFILEASVAPPSGSALQSVSTIFRRFLAALPKDTAQGIESMSLKEALEFIEKDSRSNNDILTKMSVFDQRALAASIVVVGRKPKNYSQNSSDEFAHVRREYYACRSTLMLRHHEVYMYMKLAMDRGSNFEFVDIGGLNEMLAKFIVQDTGSRDAYLRAIDAIGQTVEKLTANRDRWIGEFLRLQPDAA